MLPQELLKDLCCPKCRGPLSEQAAPPGFTCQGCRLFFAIIDGIPNFLLDDARPLGDSQPASKT